MKLNIRQKARIRSLGIRAIALWCLLDALYGALYTEFTAADAIVYGILTLCGIYFLITGKLEP